MAEENQVSTSTAPQAPPSDAGMSTDDKIIALMGRVEGKTAAAVKPTEEPPAPVEPKQAEPKTTEPPKPDEPPKEEPGEDGKPKRPGGYVRKIQKLDAEKSNLQSEVDSLKAEIASLRNIAPASQPAPAKPAAKTDDGLLAYPKPKPTMDQFESLDDYVDAAAQWQMDAREWKTQQTTRLEQMKTAQAQVSQAVDSKMGEGFKKYGKEDFDAASNDVGVLLHQKVGSPVATQLIGYLMKQDNFADVTWALANDEAALAAVVEAGDIEDAALEIRALSRKLKSESTQSGLKAKESKVPQAPNKVSEPNTGVRPSQSQLDQLNQLKKKAETSRLEEDRVAYFSFAEKLRSKAS